MPTDVEVFEKLMTVEEVAKLLNVMPAWVRAHANGNRRPKLPALKLGGHVRFRSRDLLKFLDELSGQHKK